MWWRLLVGVVASAGVLYAVLLLLVWRANRGLADPARLRDVMRLLPDIVRLLRRLAADPTVPRGVRIRLVLLIAYLASPIDLIPDFIPVLGYADDVIVVAIAIRSVIRHAGDDAIAHNWPGTPEGLRLVRRLADRDPVERS